MANLTSKYTLLLLFLLPLSSLIETYQAVTTGHVNSLKTIPKREIETFDFIVVGGGSAGAVVANRLSENAKYSVLLIDRGGIPSPITKVPYMRDLAAGKHAVDYPAKSKQITLSSFGGFSKLRAASVLGGGSSVNGMVYVRGSAAVFDEWAKISGDPGWSYQSLLPHFKAVENYHGHYKLNRTYHSDEGEVSLTAGYQVQPGSNVFQQALKERNLKQMDLSLLGEEGFQMVDINTKHGRRCGTYEAFLKPIRNRRNLHIYTQATVIKVHFDSENKAIGVTYSKLGLNKFVRASKEVIISAGAFESPKLLLLSGIGPSKDLRGIGIVPLADLPVGRNFHDHPGVDIFIRFTKKFNFVFQRDFNFNVAKTYLVNGTGPLSGPTSFLGLHSSSLNNNKNWPDILFNINQLLPTVQGPPDSYLKPKDHDTISVVLAKPRAEPGFVKLRSKNPSAQLFIHPTYLEHKDDMKILIEGINYIVDFYENSKAFAPYGAKLDVSVLPGNCKNITSRTDEFWECVIRNAAGSSRHYCGSCRMGKGVEDPDTVVDSSLRVLKTTGLRVIDASIMPIVTNANTNAPSIMIGEKGAQMILEQWR